MDDFGDITRQLELNFRLNRLLDPVLKALPAWLYSPALKMVVLEVTTACNRKCAYCPPHYALGIPPLSMEWELYCAIIESLAAKSYRGRLGFGIYGDALLDDRLEDRLGYAAARLPGTIPTVYTNGDRLTVDRFLSLRKAGMAVMIISQHSPELSPALRDALQVLKRDYPELYCISLINYHRLYAEGNKPGVMNNRGGLAEVTRRPPARCRELDYAAVDCLGNVLLCCQDCTASYVFGNAGERDFFEIWNDPAFKEVRRRIRRGDWLFEICRKCMSGKGLCTKKPAGKAPRLAPAFHDLKTAMTSLGLAVQAAPPAEAAGIKFLALGDSYTACSFVEEKDRWPVRLAEALRLKGQKIAPPRTIAALGWRTDQLQQAVDAAKLRNDYGLVSLLIGVNDEYQGKTAEEYAAGFEELLQAALRLAGGKKENVFVLSIPDYGFTPFGKSKQPKISRAIDRFNELNRAITEKLGIKYIFITDLTREGLARPELVAEDGIHPSGLMYGLWVERITAALRNAKKEGAARSPDPDK